MVYYLSSLQLLIYVADNFGTSVDGATTGYWTAADYCGHISSWKKQRANAPIRVQGNLAGVSSQLKSMIDHGRLDNTALIVESTYIVSTSRYIVIVSLLLYSEEFSVGKFKHIINSITTTRRKCTEV